MQHSPGFIKITDDTKKYIKETDINTVHQRLQKNEKFFLVDVREESEWAKGHLPNAIHLSKGIIERDIEKNIPDLNAEIILYCGGGSRSALAADNLQKMGYTHVKSMQGGFRGWVEAGLTIK